MTPEGMRNGWAALQQAAKADAEPLPHDVVHFEKGRVCHVVRDADGEPAIYECPGDGCEVCAYYDSLPKRTVTVTRVDREAGTFTVEAKRG